GLRLDPAELVGYAFERSVGASFFDAWSKEAYDLPNLPQHAALMEQARRLLRFQPGDRVLDIGSGDGRLLRYIERCERVVCVDISAQMLQQISDQRALYPFEISLHRTDFLSFAAPERYSKASSIMGMHHIPHPAKAEAVARCRDLLEDGGALFLG